VVGLQAVEAFEQLAGDRLGIAVRGVGAFADDDHVVANAAVGDPPAEESFHQPADVLVGGVEGVAAASDEVVEHRGRVCEGSLVVASHDEAGDVAIDAGNAAGGHRMFGAR
jgi:hypothetical protein